MQQSSSVVVEIPGLGAIVVTGRCGLAVAKLRVRKDE